MKDALAHTELAMSLHPLIGEALFQAAKVHMALGQIDSAFPILGKAIDLDRFYALKAAGDGDFQKHDDRLRDFLEALRKEKYRQCLPTVKAALEKIAVLRQYAPSAKTNPAISRMEACIATGGKWPLMDMLSVVQNLDAIIAEMKSLPIVVPIKGPDAIREREEKYPVQETYEEKVVIKPGGLFRKAVTELQTKTRTVMKTRIIKEKVAGQSVSMEFCYIPPGTFMMGDDNEAHSVILTKGFHLSKYPVTQAQWQAVMGENPSGFKGKTCRWKWFPMRIAKGLLTGSTVWADCLRIVCPQKPNGNMPAGLVPQQHSALEVRKAGWGNMPGMLPIQIVKRIWWARKSPMSGDYMICMAMCGNGVRIGMAIILPVPRSILMVLLPARTVCLAAAVGVAMPGTAGWRTAATTR